VVDGLQQAVLGAVEKLQQKVETGQQATQQQVASIGEFARGVSAKLSALAAEQQQLAATVRRLEAQALDEDDDTPPARTHALPAAAHVAQPQPAAAAAATASAPVAVPALAVFPTLGDAAFVPLGRVLAAECSSEPQLPAPDAAGGEIGTNVTQLEAQLGLFRKLQTTIVPSVLAHVDRTPTPTVDQLVRVRMPNV
jgi:hypothetical protein